MSKKNETENIKNTVYLRIIFQDEEILKIDQSKTFWIIVRLHF